MKLLKILMLASGLMVGWAPHAVAQSSVPKTDNQSWNDVQITIPMAKQVDFTIQVTVRLGDNITKPVDERWGVGYVFKLNKYLSFNPFYFHREARPPDGKHESEDRVTLGAMVRFPLKKFTLSDRNWLERRWRHPQVNAWRYRNRVQVEHPFQLIKQKFTWFVANEVFYDWSLHVWSRNRAFIGITHPFGKHLTLDVYYMRQNDGRTKPGNLNIIGTTWRLRR